MKKPSIQFEILKEDIGYSAYTSLKNRTITTQGDTLYELKEMIVEAVNLTFEDLNFKYSIDEIKLYFNLHSFFSHYKVINVKALSERIGMNQTLLSQYIKGRKSPSIKQRQRILKGVHDVARELLDVKIL